MKRPTIVALAALLSLLAVLGPAMVAPRSSSGKASEPSGGETIDELMARVAVQVPAFGGLYVDDESNTLFVLLTDVSPDVVESAQEAINSVFPAGSLPQENVTALRAQFGFLTLKEWHDRMKPRVLGLTGVVFTDIDDRTNQLVVGVENLDSHASAVRAELAARGIPLGAVIIEETQPVKLLTSLRDFHRPLVGGLQIRFPGFICTMGFNANRQGISGFVVNSHCTTTQGGVEGTVYHQPDSTLGAVARIGVETRDPTYSTGGACPAGRRCRWSDSAFARLDTGVLARQGHLARPPVGSISWNGVDTFRIVAEEAPVVDRIITKVGRTSGRTSGRITRTCVDTNVFGTNITFFCQSFAATTSQAGDSGSPVFRITNQTDARLNGILWGGNGDMVFSPIGNIERTGELGPLGTGEPAITGTTD